jgi:hypothetical protein
MALAYLACCICISRCILCASAISKREEEEEEEEEEEVEGIPNAASPG